MDTLRLIKINDNQLYVELSSTSIDFSKKITVNFQIDSVKSESRKITHDILNNYVQNGPSSKQLKKLKTSAFELFNFLDFFKLEQYFNQVKRNNKNHYLHFIIDSELNSIPFEILHDGKDFLSDFLILSREFTDTNISNDKFKIESKKKFSIVANPSESDDINDDVLNEANLISNIVGSNFNLRGPFKNRNVNKVELIRLLGSSSLFHFSGHYENGGWKLFDDSFQPDDILKCSKSSDFIFSNSCGHYTKKFMIFISAFLNKGTKTIICSLGKLPSNKAVEFTNIFYKYFIQHGHDVGESLFLTKKQMIKKNGYKDIVWCFYQLYGSSLLSINKKNNLISSNSKKTLSKNLVFIVSFLLVSTFIYNYFDNPNYQTELEINVQSNINANVQKEIIKSDAIQSFHNKTHHYPLLLKCDSILNGKPYFSLVDTIPKEKKFKKTFQLIIDVDNDFKDDRIVRYPYTYNLNNDLLNLYVSNKTNFNRIKLIFDDNIEYSVHLQYEKRNSKKVFMLHIVDILNDIRYKINVDQLYKMISPIHKDHLKLYRDELAVLFPRDSQFELIKKDFKFQNRLVLDINKKALIN